MIKSLSGWANATIGDVAEVSTGSTPKRTESKYWENADIPWLTSSVTGKPICKSATQFVSSLAVKECRLKTFSKGTLLLAMYGEGKTRGQVTEIKIDATCNQACAAIAVDSQLASKEFVKYRLLENYQATRLAAAGGNQPNLNLNKVRAIITPLAPLKEQKRIVEKLDSLLAQVDTIQQRLNHLPDIIKRFRQSVLAAAVSGKLTEQWRVDKGIEEWESTTIGDNFLTVDGDRGRNYPKKEEYQHEGYCLFLSTKNVRKFGFDFTNTVFLNEEKHNVLRNGTLERGDLVITTRGTLGHIASYDECVAFPVVRINSGMLILRKINTDFINDFFKILIASPKFQRDIDDNRTGSAQPQLPAKILKKFNFLLPSIEEQTEIVRKVEQYFALADTLEKNLANAKQRVDNLTQSILAKAFRGELVPQDPNDEPADKLLARIKAARLEAEKLEKAAKKAAKASKK